MKVLALVILVIGSSSGLGSGPYLPSGWRPTGPAFYLPSEIQRTTVTPLEDVAVQEESSGSEALREYGPPKEVELSQITREVSQDLTQQALPDPVTEQAFVVIEAKFEEEKAGQLNQEAVTEQIQAVEESVTTTDSQNTADESTTQSDDVIQGRSLNVESQTESTLVIKEESTDKIGELNEEEEITEEKTDVTQNIEVSKENFEVSQNNVEVEVRQENVDVTQDKEAVTQKETQNDNTNIDTVEEKEVTEVKMAEEGVKNIAEALVNLENEIKAQEVRANHVIEITTVEKSSGNLQQAPEGFLEYGPPGFTEYGPPKGDLRIVTAAEETNEVRRRRFSPKFKSLQRNH